MTDDLFKDVNDLFEDVIRKSSEIVRNKLRSQKAYEDARRLLDINDCYSFNFKTPEGEDIPIRNVSDLAYAITVAENLIEMGLDKGVVIGHEKDYVRMLKEVRAFRLAVRDNEAMVPFNK